MFNRFVFYSMAFGLLLSGSPLRAQPAPSSIDLAGPWKFQADPQDVGVREKWYLKEFPDIIHLPGSMTQYGKGDDLSLATKWTGGIVDQSWFTAPEFAKYREPGNIKVPFWLTPDKHYVGPAWYQKDIVIPDSWQGRRITLFLERCHWETRLWVDEKEAGMRNSLSTPHEYDLTQFLTPGRHTLTLFANVGRFENRWDFWVYPARIPPVASKDVLVVRRLDQKAVDHLNRGGKVLLTVEKGAVKPEKGGSVAIGFSSIFWNTAWTSKQPPHTLGVLCDPKHPALADFPTEFHSNWQWWDAMSHSQAMILDDFGPALKPIVRVIDDWFTNRNLGLIFEAKVGQGKLLVSSIDLMTNLDKRPEARQLLYSLKKYAASGVFLPQQEVDIAVLRALFKDLPERQFEGGTSR